MLKPNRKTPDGGPTTASRQTHMTGNAARLAARTLREVLTARVAEKYDQPPASIRFEEELARVNGNSIPPGQAVQIIKQEERELKALYEYWAPKTQPLGAGGDMHFAFSYAAQAAEVEVDTGEAHVLQPAAARDIGRAIQRTSPLIR